MFVVKHDIFTVLSAFLKIYKMCKINSIYSLTSKSREPTPGREKVQVPAHPGNIAVHTSP